MRVALLTGANPQRSKGGPYVRLLPGEWCFEMENVKDTKLTLHLEDTTDQSLWDENLKNDRVREIRVSFAYRGTESHISVFARKVA